MTLEAELASEQAYCDTALDCREHTRATRGEGAGAAATTAAAAWVKRAADEAIESMARPEEPVAIGKYETDEDETYYVGKDTIWSADMELLVLSWKNPGASRFYEATPQVPQGVTRKRTFECDETTIKRFEDVVMAQLAEDIARLDEPIFQDALLDDLNRSRTGEMADIVKTIEAAQFELIRAPLDQLLVVQGGPGTGKTAIALHRVSWLLYNERDRLSAQDVLVVGPTKAFVRYVASVLPALGDREVAQRSVRELAPEVRYGPEADARVVRTKGEDRMALLLRRGLQERIGLPEEDLELSAEGRSVRLPRSELEPLVERARHLPYATARNQFRDSLRERVTPAMRNVEFRTALDGLVERVFPQLTPAAFLQELLGSEGRLLRAAGDDFSALEVQLLYRRSADRLSEQVWTPSDAPLLDHADQLINGDPTRRFGHIVIDEAQDLSPMQLRSIRRRSATGSMTVFGDLAQSCGAWARDSWAEVVEALRIDLPVVNAALEFGYRVPRRIFDVAARLLPEIAPDVPAPQVVREGPSDPDFVEAVDDGALVREVANSVREYSARGNSVGVICSIAAFDRVARQFEDDSMVWRDVGREGPGSSINLVRAADARGLEFDAVVVVEPEAISGDMERGGRLLYVALTRTTRHLTVVYTRRPATLLGDVSPADVPQGDAYVDSPTADAETETNAVDFPSEAATGTSEPAKVAVPRIVSAIASELAQDIRASLRDELFAETLLALAEELGLEAVVERREN